MKQKTDNISAERNRDYYDKEYVDKERTPKDIAEEFGTYPNKIRRELKKLGYKLRDKSEAQKLALASGRHAHPTKGQKRSQSVRESISDSMATSWENMSPVEKDRRAKLAQKQWREMSQDERLEFKRLAVEGLRKASKNGSQLELYLYEKLAEIYPSTLFHMEFLFDSEKMHADLYVAEANAIIEIDGPSHYENIWGEATLKRNQITDAHKDKTLTERGYNIIRVKHTVKTVSDSYKRKLTQLIVEELSGLTFADTRGELVRIDPSARN